MIRLRVVALAALVVASGGFRSPRACAQVNLAETPAAGDCARYTLDLELTGKMFFTEEGAKQELKLDARGRHAFTERTLTVDGGLPVRSARHYGTATASALVGSERADRTLPADRALIGTVRNSEGLHCFCPAGPLTRDELDLVTEHFNPQCIPGLLPGKAVNVGDTWKVPAAATQAACLFDGLIRSDLTGKLTASANGTATFTIEGSAEGIENGAKVTVSVTATGTYDIAAGRVVQFTWKQKDDRALGPVSPESKVEATVTLKREALAAAPKELDDTALAAMPRGDVPVAMMLLRHADPKGRYTLTYARDWHVTGLTDDYLILRLLEKGEFIAQATIAGWKKADPGKHTPAEEFKKAVGSAPGWTATRVLEDIETTTPDGRWLYRIAAEGKMEDLPVVQTFHLLAGPQGDQAAVTFAMKPEKQKAVGARDRELVNALVFPKK